MWRAKGACSPGNVGLTKGGVNRGRDRGGAGGSAALAHLLQTPGAATRGPKTFHPEHVLAVPQTMEACVGAVRGGRERLPSRPRRGEGPERSRRRPDRPLEAEDDLDAIESSLRAGVRPAIAKGRGPVGEPRTRRRPARRGGQTPAQRAGSEADPSAYLPVLHSPGNAGSPGGVRNRPSEAVVGE